MTPVTLGEPVVSGWDRCAENHGEWNIYTCSFDNVMLTFVCSACCHTGSMLTNLNVCCTPMIMLHKMAAQKMYSVHMIAAMHIDH